MKILTIVKNNFITGIEYGVVDVADNQAEIQKALRRNYKNSTSNYNQIKRKAIRSRIRQK